MIQTKRNYLQIFVYICFEICWFLELKLMNLKVLDLRKCLTFDVKFVSCMLNIFTITHIESCLNPTQYLTLSTDNNTIFGSIPLKIGNLRQMEMMNLCKCA